MIQTNGEESVDTEIKLVHLLYMYKVVFSVAQFKGI